MKTLPLNKALELYDILRDYIPSEYDLDDIFNFAGTIIKNINKSGKHRDYMMALSLMLEYSIEHIVQNSNPQEAIKLFLNGIITNQMPRLVDYCKKIGY